MISSIDHKIRIRLHLSMTEYAVLDFLYSFKGIARYMDYEKNLGMSKGEVQQALMSLKSKAMIAPQSSGEILICVQWNEIFDVPDHIELIWKLHPTGSKAVCRERLKKVLKKISIEDLSAKLKAYLAACKEADQYAKNLETWLNPKSEHWASPLPVKKEFAKPGEQPKSNVTYVLK